MSHVYSFLHLSRMDLDRYNLRGLSKTYTCTCIRGTRKSNKITKQARRNYSRCSTQYTHKTRRRRTRNFLGSQQPAFQFKQERHTHRENCLYRKLTITTIAFSTTLRLKEQKGQPAAAAAFKKMLKLFLILPSEGRASYTVCPLPLFFVQLFQCMQPNQ